ncbi:putative ABC transport system permease protein [Meinhardsimonia xiamenensis]|jgi:putative ABC transport system permease protein|uniref:Putative ABC transport system permease protein n=1 Tax=Meinhardsimonia xiamenensis TaxID=990712 RepID=A0A1G9FMP8_9RHOB|nr:FtsX-like permease family protein [Meinhardsimonia xiamenensis]PRX37769.1 putative ABC transport system permease protein [Meinhardsimonia xiamenensis]SDK89612.1 putative ABC transport system permease protein [Meinhardsimonia xiamenensis]
MTRAGLQALLSHWWRHPGQLVMLLAGLMLATALWSGVQAINAEARAAYAQAAGRVDAGARARIVPRAGERLDEAQYVALRRAGWPVSPVVEAHLTAGGATVRLIGIDPITTPSDLIPRAFSGTDSAETLRRFLLPPHLVFAAPDVAAALAEATGAEVRAADDLAPGTAVADVGFVQRLGGAEGLLDRLIVTDAPRALAPPPLETIAPGLVLQPAAPRADLARLTASFHLNLSAFGLLAFAVGLFIAHGAVGLAFEARRGMFRTLRALGLPLWHLMLLIALELALMALVAGAAGMVAGLLIAGALLPDVAASLKGLYGAEVPGTLTLRAQTWVAGMAAALAGAGLAGAGALWQLARLPVLAPAMPRAWARASAHRRALEATGGLALLVAAAALARFGSGLMAGFALMAALLLGAALILPPLLDLCLRLAGRAARGPLSQWFWADARQGLPGLSLAMMALLLALAANIGVGTMVESFRRAFTGWLDQRLAAELYVRARDDAEAERLRAFLAGRSEAVLPLWRVEATVAGVPSFVYGVEDHPTYRENWPLLDALPGVWDRLAAGEAALINEQLARRAGLSPGDTIEILPGWRLEVAGIYSDYGNPTGQVMVALAPFLAHFPDAPRLSHAVRVAPEDAPALARALIEEFGLPAENVVDQAALKRWSLSIFERTFAITAALNVLTLGVAGVAIVTSLAALSGQRLVQLAPVWAVGVERRRLARLELLRALALAALTAALALPLGLALAWVLLAIVNVEAFGWRLPMQLFPLDWLRLVALALLAAALAALWPALRLARMAPARLVQVFAAAR